MEEDETIDIPLYRMQDLVKKEVIEALKFWSKNSLLKNETLVLRGINDLNTPYSSTKGIKSSTNESFPVQKLHNGIEGFKGYIDTIKNQCTNEQDKNLFDKLKLVFITSIESLTKE